VARGKGFFGSLFDFSFHSFVYPKIISFFYAVLVILMSLAAVGAIVAAFTMSDWESSTGLPPWAMIIIAPIAYLLYLIVIRTGMEIAIVLFRIYDNTGRLADQAGGKG
jgi:hypothetical protein